MISFPGVLSLWCCFPPMISFCLQLVGLPPTRALAFDNQNAPTSRAKPLILAIWLWRVPV